ncbi:MAG: LPS export ABC transporter permease LptG [Ignavibacteriae bacterium]|nr:LPS export ABC transporter permease LptG [Ignavibacteria bacterium]MBI3364834.1 LPS export ABC transporter permease LptG [Ignavibacteriota bacterium]
MTRIDRYVLRQFIQMALFVLVGFMVLFVVVDMMENLDDFLDKQAAAGIIATYYFYFLPEIIKLTIPVAMLLSALFTTGRLSTFNELAAMKSSGMSLYRFMAPLLLFAFLVSGVSIYFNGWVVPYANKKKFDIGRVYFQKNIQYVARNNIFIQDSPTRILSIGLFDDTRGVAQQVSIQDFVPDDPTRLAGRYDAAEMRWDPQSKTWTLVNGTERRFVADHEQSHQFATVHIGALNFAPEDIRKKQQKPEEMDYNELQQFIENQKRSGHDVSRWLVEHYEKVAFPMASVIVVLFGVPISSIKRRSGLGVQFAIGLLVCFLYIVFLKISQAFGYNGDLDPLLTAWLANIIFFTVGIYNLIRVPK